MSRKLRISRTALRDIDKGVNWFKVQQKGLGKKFQSRVNATLKNIRKFPYSASFAYDTVRYKVMEVFPYNILYEFDDLNI